ncbi:hypothetical protein MDA_GLEAN10016675 [Myotis davidii]|uniref:Uncharacterized protein n=1 Tax=Myotis davidii TaxID=225400 RepID=L5M5E8_MYODS|nr:hypothetical protein MDA_GLEAN10016675 [Myotis davidii]
MPLSPPPPPQLSIKRLLPSTSSRAQSCGMVWPRIPPKHPNQRVESQSACID